MSDWPMVHTLHWPFTEQASMLYRRIARRHWFLGIAPAQSHDPFGGDCLCYGACQCAGLSSLERRNP